MWHPLTTISHMLDCQIFGLNPLWHHFINVLFHILNALLIFWILTATTGAMWPSAFVAAVFACIRYKLSRLPGQRKERQC